MISQKSIQDVIAIASVQDIISDYVNLKRRGINMIGLCPFHNEKTPSFTVSPGKNIYKCFGCGKGGNAVQFLMEHEQLTFPESIRHLAKRYGIELEETATSQEYKEEQKLNDSLYVVNDFANEYFQKQLKETDEGKSIGLSYFKKRGFLESTIDKFQLGYANEKNGHFYQAAVDANFNKELLFKLGLSKKEFSDFFRSRVMFSIHNLSGKVVGFGGRTLSENKKIPKYLNSPESQIYNKRKSLYGMYFAKKGIRQEDECILVEGYTDTIALHQAGIDNVVASSGTSLTIDQIKLIKRYTDNVKVLYDGDAAGIKAAMRGMNLILEQDMNIKLVELPDGEDPDSYLTKLGATAFKEFINKEAKDFILFKVQMISEEAGNDPIQKTNLIKDIVETIAKIPDTIKRSAYIQQCSQMLEIREEILIKESNKIISGDIRRKRLEADREQLQSQNEDVFVTDKKIAPKQSNPVNLDSQEYQEKDLSRIAVLYGNATFLVDEEESGLSVIEFMHQTLETHYDKFKNELYLDIIQKAFAEYKTNGKLESSFFTNHERKEIREYAIDIFSPKYFMAKWKEKGAGLLTQKDPEFNASRDVEIALYRYILILLNKQLADYSRKLKEENNDTSKDSDIIKTLQIVQKLQQERATLSKHIETNLTYKI